MTDLDKERFLSFLYLFDCAAFNRDGDIDYACVLSFTGII